MQLRFTICSIFVALNLNAQIAITNNTLLTTWSDSLANGQYGNRQNFFLMSHFIFMHPDFTISVQENSRSGGSNWEMLVNRIQRWGFPGWGAAARGGTNCLDFFYTSDNGGPNSNTICTNFIDLVQSPTWSYATNPVSVYKFTNDWPYSTNLFTRVIIGELALQQADGNPGVRDRDRGAQNVAIANGMIYIPSWSNTVVAVSNAYAQDPTAYWFPNTHPGNEIQMIWHLTNLRSMGEPSNVYTAVLDWNSSSPSQTNSCVVSGIQRSSSSFAFTFHADRMDGGYYTPDASQTNNCSGAYTLMPSLSNYVCEIVRITNAPVGTYSFQIDGTTVSSGIDYRILTNGLNMYKDIHSGALWEQKKKCLAYLCDMANVNTTNCSEQFQTNGNTYWVRFASYSVDRWTTNSGMTDYINIMQDRVNEIAAQDVLIHANAQQTNHTFTFTLEGPYAPAPFR